MTKQYFFRMIVVVGIVVAGCSFAHGAHAAGTGFVDSPLWITPGTPNDGDKVRLYAAFRNEEAATISGTILFYDNDTLLASKPVTILSGDVGLASTSFKINAGEHQFSATMSNAAALMTSGKTGVVVVSKATVELPQQFIPKVVAVTAQAGGETTADSQGLILNQVDQAETKVLSVVPAPVKNATASTATALDTWRANQAASFSQSQQDAEDAINHKVVDASAQPAPNILGTKTTAKPAPVLKSDAGPMTYVKLVFFSTLAFLFSYAIVFYVLLVVAVFILVRFIFRKIRNAIRKGDH